MRRRTRDRHLPPCVYHKHGAYYFVRRGKWIRLGASLSEALSRYARLVTEGRGDMVDILDRAVEDARTIRRLADNTIEQYELAARYLKDALLEFAVDEVEPRHVKAIMDHYADRPYMANRMRTVLKLAFAGAIARGLRQTNPAREIEPFRERKRDRYLTDEEWRAIYAEASPALRCIMDVAYYTGQRIGDVLSIRLDQVSDEGIQFRQQKTGKPLLVRSSPGLSAAVERAKALHRRTTSMYLLGQRNGNIRSYYAARDLLRRAAQKAGVADVRWHDIRAKSLTDADAQGRNAQALAGHSTEAQTIRYLRGKKVPVVDGPASIRQKSG